MSPHTETPQVLVLSTTRHELHASLLTTDLHVVGGHSVAWSEHEVEHAVKPEQEGDDTADSVSGSDSQTTFLETSSTDSFSLHTVLGAFDSLLPVLAEHDLSTIQLVTSHVHTLSPTDHSSPQDTSSHTAAQPGIPGTCTSIDNLLEAGSPSHHLDALNSQSSLNSPETSSEPVVLIPDDFLDRLESLHIGDRLSDVLRSTTSGGLTATPPRISRPSKARRSAHQHSDRTDPSDQDPEYGGSVATDHPSSPPLGKWDNTGHSPGYETPDDRLEVRKVSLRWLLYALLTRGGGVVGPLLPASTTPSGSEDSRADCRVKTKETVGVWWAKWGLRGAAVASPIVTALLLPNSAAPDDIHIHLGRTDTLSIRFPDPTAARLETITRLGGVILPFQRNGAHSCTSSRAEEDVSTRIPVQEKGSPTRPAQGHGEKQAEYESESGVCAVWVDNVSPAFRREVRDKYGNGKWSQFGLLANIIPAGGSMGLDDKLFLFPRPSGPPVRFESGLPVTEFRELRANARCAFESQFMYWRALLRELDVGVRRIILTGSAAASPAVVSILSHIFRSAIYVPAYPHPFDVLSASLALAGLPQYTATRHWSPSPLHLSQGFDLPRSPRPLAPKSAETDMELARLTPLRDGENDDPSSSTPRQIVSRSYVPLTPPPSATQPMRHSGLNKSSPPSPSSQFGRRSPMSPSEPYGRGGIARPDTQALSHVDYVDDYVDPEAFNAFSDTDPTPRVRIVELPPTPPSEPAELPPTRPARSPRRVTWTNLLPATTTVLEESESHAIIDGPITPSCMSSMSGTSGMSGSGRGVEEGSNRAGATVAITKGNPDGLDKLRRLVCLRYRADGEVDGAPWEEKVYEAMQVEYERLRNLVERGFVGPVADRADRGSLLTGTTRSER